MQRWADPARIARHLDALGQFGREPLGVSRLSYTPAYRQAVTYLKEEMGALGMACREDGVGNLYGLLPGTQPDAPPFLSGSHLDTVRHGGQYDGQAGIICALECARLLVERKISLRHNFEVLATTLEDGARFPAVLGSMFIDGSAGARELETTRELGGTTTLAQAIAQDGLPGDLTQTCRRGQPAAGFFEIHLEQGPVLEREQLPLGLVTAISGMRWLEVVATGRTCHPGATPMDARQDAALCICRLVAACTDMIKAQYLGRACLTAGCIETHPGIPNAVAGRCRCTFDLRTAEPGLLDEIPCLLEPLAQKIAATEGVTVEIRSLSREEPVTLDESLYQVLAQRADAAGLPWRPMVSGAGHDAMILSSIWPCAMIFVPSLGGLTHCPQELADPNHLALATDLLLNTLLALDAQ